MSIQLLPGLANEPLDRVLEDLLVRFVVNASAEDLSTNARVFFLFEEAHWFYLDYVRALNPELPLLRMKSFCKRLIEVCPIVWKGGDPSEGLKEFVSYKQSIPVRGAALFNSSMTKLLLVQGVESASWSFPRGKISKDEDDADCAVREVKEEIGMDITPYLNKDDYIERTLRGKNYRIYLCRNIPDDFDFKPVVKNEIRSISWMDFKKIGPKIKQDNNKFFLVNSMYQALQQWVKKNKGEYNETQLKLEVETQLKSMLGLKDDKKEAAKQDVKVDPGRDLLDFIRKSSANKHLDNIKQQIHDSKQTSIQQQQQPVQQLPQQQFVLPFMPPAQGQFMPFAPIPIFMPQSMGQPGGPVPIFANYPSLQQQQQPVLIQNSQALQQHPHQHQHRFPQEHELHAPNANQLSRPSVSITVSKNEEQSRELLSILNNKNIKNNAKELLSLFNKKKDNQPQQEKLSSDVKKTISNDIKNEVKSKGGSDYSQYLLGLLNQTPKPDSKITSEKNPYETTVKETTESLKISSSSASKDLLNLIKGSGTTSKIANSTSSSSSIPRAQTPFTASNTTNGTPGSVKPKLKILKRNEELPASPASVQTNEVYYNSFNQDKVEREQDQDQEAVYEEDDDEEYESPSKVKTEKPSKELLELIKKTQQRSNDEEFEKFEDYTDEEFEDEDEENYDDGEEEVYEEEQEQYQDDEYTEAYEEELNNAMEEIESYEYEPETHEFHNVNGFGLDKDSDIFTPPVIEHFDNPENLKEFSKDNEEAQEEVKKPKKMLLKRGQDLDELLKSESGQEDDENEEEEFEDASDLTTHHSTIASSSTNNNAKNDLLNLLHRRTTPASDDSTASQSFDLKSIETNLDEIESNFDEKPPIVSNQSASDSLLSLLQQPKKETSNDPSKTLLGLLHKNIQTSAPVEPLRQPSIEPTPSPQPTASSNPLLDLLHRNKSSTSSTFGINSSQSPSPAPQSQQESSQNLSQSLLNLLKKPTPKNPTPPPVEQPSTTTYNNTNAGNELLSILHKSVSP